MPSHNASRKAQGCFSCVYTLLPDPQLKKKVSRILPPSIKIRASNQDYWFGWIILLMDESAQGNRTKPKLHQSIKRQPFMRF